jgi:hypothetical protein
VSDAPWIEWGDAVPRPDDGLRWVIVSAVGHPAPAEERHAVLRDVVLGLAGNGGVVVVDHNRPRRLFAALAAVVGTPRVPGWSPGRRWRRLAHPTARAVQGAGLRVDRLRLVAGERVQIVVATRAPA